MANYVKFRKGSPEAYAQLESYDEDTLYFIYEADDDDGRLYLGSKLISSNITIDTIGQLSDVIIDTVKDKQILVYDSTISAWVNKDHIDLIEEFVGATEFSSGKAGLVPAPTAEETNRFLRSDGTWSTLDEVIKEAVKDKVDYDNLQNAVDTAVAAAGHLKRKIVLYDAIDPDATDANQYIYLVPNQYDEYDEYMVVEGKIEKIGSFTANLEGYATKEDLKTKVDITYFEVDGELEPVPGVLLSPVDKKKLDALIFDESGNINISTSVNAENVQGLGDWIASNGATHITGLTSNNLDATLLNTINFITSVNTDNFSVIDGNLKLNKISQSQVEGLEAVISTLDETYINKNSFNSTIEEIQGQVDTLTEYLTWQNL